MFVNEHRGLQMLQRASYAFGCSIGDELVPCIIGHQLILSEQLKY